MFLFYLFLKNKGDKLATRQAYGTALVKVGKNNDRVCGLDGDMKNSTFSQELRKLFPERHVECFICEQNLAGVGIGMACRDRTVVFMSTFACFFTRAFDNFRMGVISQTNINVAVSSTYSTIISYVYLIFCIHI